MLFPRFTFDKIRGVQSVSFSLSRGVSPSLCSATILPNVPLDRRPHTMTFSDGTRSINFSECIISSVEVDANRQMLSVSILDRRWKWKFSRIAGEYNTRRGDTIIKGTRRSVRELATLCFKELGETDFDVRALPDNVFPYVEWKFDSTAAILDDLCKQNNCHVCPTPHDKFAVYADGFGNELPKLPSSSSGIGYDFGIKPASVGCVSGPMAWEVDLRLEPVGVDRDGALKLVDDMLLKPKGEWGWLSKDPYSHDMYAERYREHASTVFRYYRITLAKGQELTHAKGLLKTVRQLIPLLGYRLEKKPVETKTLEFPEDKEVPKQRLEPLVHGMFNDEGGTASNNVDGTFTKDHKHCSPKIRAPDLDKYPELIYPKKFEIDNARGLVIFGDPVFANRTGDFDPYKFPTIVWPSIYLRVAVNLHHPETFAPFRLSRKLVVDSDAPKGVKDLVDYEVKEDILPEVRTNHATGKILDNLKTVETDLGYYLENSLRKFRAKMPASGDYPILLPYAPDGRIAQVIFAIDDEGFISTSIHKEIEGLSNVVDYTERRKRLAQLAALEAQQRERTQGASDGKRKS